MQQQNEAHRAQNVLQWIVPLIQSEPAIAQVPETPRHSLVSGKHLDKVEVACCGRRECARRRRVAEGLQVGLQRPQAHGTARKRRRIGGMGQGHGTALAILSRNAPRAAPTTRRADACALAMNTRRGQRGEGRR